MNFELPAFCPKIHYRSTYFQRPVKFSAISIVSANAVAINLLAFPTKRANSYFSYLNAGISLITASRAAAGSRTTNEH